MLDIFGEGSFPGERHDVNTDMYRFLQDHAPRHQIERGRAGIPADPFPRHTSVRPLEWQRHMVSNDPSNSLFTGVKKPGKELQDLYDKWYSARTPGQLTQEADLLAETREVALHPEQRKKALLNALGIRSGNLDRASLPGMPSSSSSLRPLPAQMNSSAVNSAEDFLAPIIRKEFPELLGELPARNPFMMRSLGGGVLGADLADQYIGGKYLSDHPYLRFLVDALGGGAGLMLSRNPYALGAMALGDVGSHVYDYFNRK